jgi:hypothetical protein
MAPTNQLGEPEDPEDAVDKLTTEQLHRVCISSLMAS